MIAFFGKKFLFNMFMVCALVVLAGGMLVSCDQTTDSEVSLVHAQKPNIQPLTDGSWRVSVNPSFSLTVSAASPDGGDISYQW